MTRSASACWSAIAPDSLREYCERLAFCIVCGNTDAHLKNWSVVYLDRRHAELSPAYDILASVLYAPEKIDDRLALELGGAHMFESVTPASFKRLAAVSDVNFATVHAWVREAVQRAREAWHLHAQELPFLAAERQRLEAHMARVPLLTAS